MCGFSIGGLGGGNVIYSGIKNRHSGYHQLQITTVVNADHNTPNSSWINVDTSFNRTNNNTFIFKILLMEYMGLKIVGYLMKEQIKHNVV
jgi:hypothetical protein